MGIVAGGDLADVPDDGSVRIKIGRADEQETALLVFGRDCVEQRLIHDPPHQSAEGAVVRHGVIKDGCEKVARFEDVVFRDPGIELLELGVVIWPQEGKWGDEGAGANAGYRLETGTRAARAPAHQ